MTKTLSGFEFLSCIPGTIGGGIRMNAGCFNKEFKDILISVQEIKEYKYMIPTPQQSILELVKYLQMQVIDME